MLVIKKSFFSYKYFKTHIYITKSFIYKILSFTQLKETIKVEEEEYVTVVGLQPETSYKLAVRAVNEDTESDNEFIQLTTKGCLNLCSCLHYQKF